LIHSTIRSPRGSSPGPSPRVGESKLGTPGGFSTAASKTCVSVSYRSGFFSEALVSGAPRQYFQSCYGLTTSRQLGGGYVCPWSLQPMARVANGPPGAPLAAPVGSNHPARSARGSQLSRQGCDEDKFPQPMRSQSPFP